MRRDLPLVVGEVVAVLLEGHVRRRPSPGLAVDRPEPLPRAHDGREVDLGVGRTHRPQVLPGGQVGAQRVLEVVGQPGHAGTLAAAPPARVAVQAAVRPAGARGGPCRARCAGSAGPAPRRRTAGRRGRPRSAGRARRGGGGRRRRDRAPPAASPRCRTRPWPSSPGRRAPRRARARRSRRCRPARPGAGAGRAAGRHRGRPAVRGGRRAGRCPGRCPGARCPSGAGCGRRPAAPRPGGRRPRRTAGRRRRAPRRGPGRPGTPGPGAARRRGCGRRAAAGTPGVGAAGAPRPRDRAPASSAAGTSPAARPSPGVGTQRSIDQQSQVSQWWPTVSRAQARCPGTSGVPRGGSHTGPPSSSSTSSPTAVTAPPSAVGGGWAAVPAGNRAGRTAIPFISTSSANANGCGCGCGCGCGRGPCGSAGRRRRRRCGRLVAMLFTSLRVEGADGDREAVGVGGQDGERRSGRCPAPARGGGRPGDRRRTGPEREDRHGAVGDRRQPRVVGDQHDGAVAADRADGGDDLVGGLAGPGTSWARRAGPRVPARRRPGRSPPAAADRRRAGTPPSPSGVS